MEGKSGRNRQLPVGCCEGCGAKGGRDVGDKVFADGYNEAANICVDVLSRRIDGLMGQIKAGRDLSSKEQLLLSALTELKSETQAELYRFWDEPGGD